MGVNIPANSITFMIISSKFFSLALTVFITLVLTTGLYAQEPVKIIKSTVVKDIDGHRYYLHTVEKGHTLYSISKVYEVDIDSIKNANHGSETGLKIGQELRIPAQGGVAATDTASGFFIHIVAPGETLYGISRTYNVTIDNILQLNPEASAGLKSGQSLKIPGVQPQRIQPKEKPQKPQRQLTTYTVLEGETILEVAAKNQVSTDDLYLLNPVLKDGIYAGLILRVPVVQPSRKVMADTSFIEHKVKKDEKLADIALTYNVSIDDIVAVNPELAKGMGQPEKNTILRIPVMTGHKTDPAIIPEKVELKEMDTVVEPSLGSAPCVGEPSNATALYKVALMLPLYATDADTIVVDKMQHNSPASEYHSFRFIQFYEGALIALDSLTKTGLNVKLFVYDIGENKASAEKLVNTRLDKDLDLIIGPLFSSTFEVISQWAGQHKIPIINPLTNRSEVIQDNPHVFKAIPSNDTRIEQLASYITSTYPDDNLILVQTGTEKEKATVDTFRASLKQMLRSQGKSDSAFVEIKSGMYPGAAIRNNLKSSKTNVIIALSNEEIFVHNLFRQLTPIAKTNKIVTFGLPGWENLRNLESSDLMDLNVHLFKPSFVDYNDTAVDWFVQSFRDRYATEPDSYAFQGFDLTFYFMSALMRYGPAFSDCIPYFRLQTLQSDYHFVRSDNNGFENIFVNIFRYYNYTQRDARRFTPESVNRE